MHVEGADEVGPQFAPIKGGGAALTRENFLQMRPTRVYVLWLVQTGANSGAASAPD